MRLSPIVRRRSALAVCALFAGCGGNDAPGPDSASVLEPREVVESPGAIASRREAQGSFDTARAALARADFERAAIAMTDAATFIQDEARTAHADATQALERSAEQLDSLAVLVANREVRSPAALDRVFATTHCAEATLHLHRAHAAMVTRDNVRAGEELLMSIDHLERAAKDARVQADSAVQAAIANTRSLASEMVKGMEAVPDEVARMTNDIETAIACIGSSPPARLLQPPDSSSGVRHPSADGTNDRVRRRKPL